MKRLGVIFGMFFCALLVMAQVNNLSPDSLYKLGDSYFDQKNYELAYKYISKSAEDGYALAQNLFGYMYANGLGVTKDEEIAVEWYKKAADQGLAKAQYNMGIMYQYGKGVPPDEDTAFDWYFKAAVQGHAGSQYRVGFFYRYGAGRLTSDYKKAMDWYMKAANQGDANAMDGIADLYYWGDGVKCDYKKVLEWAEKGASKGHVGSKYMMGLIYYLGGNGVIQNYDKAAYWFKKAGNDGHDGAQFYLGKMYEEGQGVLRDYIESYKWFMKAAENNPTSDTMAQVERLEKKIPASVLASIKNQDANKKHPNQPNQQAKPSSDVDIDIPTSDIVNSNTFAFIIGNEEYLKVEPVKYALNDASIFAEYCHKILGLPKENVKLYKNATLGDMMGTIKTAQKIANAYKGDISIIYYYAGHGIPNESTKDAYLLPVDADGLNMDVCYPLARLYKELGTLNVRNVTIFMDACFSGAQRGNGMVVAARGVAIKVKNDRPMGKAVVFTAASDKQTAMPYDEKGHGLFTYCLLKKMRDSKGNCTLGELGQYVCDEVAKRSVVINGKEQTAVILTPVGNNDNWKNIKLK